MSEELNRRDLLRLTPLKAGPAGLSGSETAGPPGQPVWTEREAALGEYRFAAMGCQFELFFPGGLGKAVVEAGGRVADLVELIENEISVYRPGSSLSRLNAAAARRPVPVSGHLAGLLPICLDWNARTGGAYDCTLGPLARAWGFRVRQPRLPSPEEIAAALETTGSHWLEWSSEVPSIRFRREGVEIDFNGIGKGYAMRAAAELLRGAGQRHFLVHGGQSSVVAAGHETGAADLESEARGWRIGIADPIVPRRRIAEIRLVDEALATSGSARQALIHQGQRYGHVLDPRTGWPAGHWLSATAIHADATVCDALSTALMVMSEAEIDIFAREHPVVGILNTRVLPEEQGLELKTWNIGARDIVISPPAI